MTTQPGDPDFDDIHIVAIDLAQSQPPDKRILEFSAMEIASSDPPHPGGVAFLLDRQPPDGWGECLLEAEAELGYEQPFSGTLSGDTIEVDFDPERLNERFTGLKVAIANANARYRQILLERAENRRRAEEAAAEYRGRVAEAAERLGIRTVGE